MSAVGRRAIRVWIERHRPGENLSGVDELPRERKCPSEPESGLSLHARLTPAVSTSGLAASESEIRTHRRWMKRGMRLTKGEVAGGPPAASAAERATGVASRLRTSSFRL